MDRNHSRLIVFLLAGILFVLLLGREAALSSLQGLSGLLIALLILFFIGTVVLAVFKAPIDYYWETVAPLRRARQPWVYKLVQFLAGLMLLIVIATAGFQWFMGAGTFDECWRLLPLAFIGSPFILWFGSPLVLAVETFVGWLRRPRKSKLKQRLENLRIAPGSADAPR